MTVRTQIYLPEGLHDRLKYRARLLNKPMAEQVREALERYLDAEDTSRAAPDDPIWRLPDQAMAGSPGGPADVATRHDEYLYGRNRPSRARRTGKPAPRNRQR